MTRSTAPRFNLWSIAIYIIAGGFVFTITGFFPCLGRITWMLLLWLVLGIGLVLYRFPQQRQYILLSISSLLLVFIILEGGTRLYMRVNHGYNVLLQPHPTTGWILVPNEEFIYSGADPTCIPGKITVRTNSLGHYDYERTPEKPPNTTRIALLGDSFVAAIENPLNRKASQVLQGYLDDENRETRFEVMDFGVSNHSLGQTLIVYEEHAHLFEIDYTFLLVSEFTLDRIFMPNIADIEGNNYRLRPVFTLDENGNLQRTDVAEYDMAMQEFNRRVAQDGVYSPLYLRPASPADWEQDPFGSFVERIQFASFMSYRILGGIEYILRNTTGFTKANWGPLQVERSEALREANLAVIAELARQVAADGGRLVIVDDTYSPKMSPELQQLAATENIGYARLNDRIIQANEEKQATNFLCDSHYNELGQQIMADTIFDWLIEYVDNVESPS